MHSKIDKSKLTDAERAFLESIEKRYGTDDETIPGDGGTETVPASAPAEPKAILRLTPALLHKIRQGSPASLLLSWCYPYLHHSE